MCGVCAVVVVAEAGEGREGWPRRGGSVRKKALLILVCVCGVLCKKDWPVFEILTVGEEAVSIPLPILAHWQQRCRRPTSWVLLLLYSIPSLFPRRLGQPKEKNLSLLLTLLLPIQPLFFPSQAFLPEPAAAAAVPHKNFFWPRSGGGGGRGGFPAEEKARGRISRATSSGEETSLPNRVSTASKIKEKTKYEGGKRVP